MKWKLCILFLAISISAQSQDCDILITNGKIIDGTGNNWYYGNIAIKDGKIYKIGRDLNLAAKKTIDAKGLIIAPGFIDVHTHLEGDEAKDPNATNLNTNRRNIGKTTKCVRSHNHCSIAQLRPNLC